MIDGIILAAGKGTRMKEIVPKVLITIDNKSMIENTVFVLKQVCDKVIVVVGENYQKIHAKLKDDVIYSHQSIPMGTLDALITTIPLLDDQNISIIVPADIPYLDKETIELIVDDYDKAKNCVLVVGMKVENPKGYGRLKMKNDKLLKIIEEKEAIEEEKKINIVNSGIYIIPNKLIKKYHRFIKPSAVTNEYYLTDLINYMIGKEKVMVKVCHNSINLEGVNDIKSLERLKKQHQNY